MNDGYESACLEEWKDLAATRRQKCTLSMAQNALFLLNSKYINFMLALHNYARLKWMEGLSMPVVICTFAITSVNRSTVNVVD